MFAILQKYFSLGMLSKDQLEEPISYEEDVLSPRRTSNKKRLAVLWTIGVYLSVILGVIGKYIFDIALGNDPFTGLRVVVSVIIATAVFPSIYKMAKLDSEHPNVLQLFVAFQNGFWWQTIFGEIGKPR